MGTRAPRPGDNIEILRDLRSETDWSPTAGDIHEIVGLWAEGVVIQHGPFVCRLLRRREGLDWKNLTVHDSQTQAWAPTQTGVQNMKKQAFNVLILQHMPVPGIPETTADIETTKVFGPEMVLAVNGESAKALAMRKLPETVNVEYIDVLIRPF